MMNLMLIWYLVFLLSFILSRSEFTYPGICILTVSFLLMPFLLIKKNIEFDFDIKIFLPIICALSIISFGSGGLYQNNYGLITLTLLAISLAISFVPFLTKRSNLLKNSCLIMVLIAFIARFMMVWGSPDPKIDVYDFLKLGAIGFTQGINPYANTYTPMYKGTIPDYYAYLPGTLFLTTPFVFLLNDPRYAHIMADLLVVLLLFKLVKSKDRYIYPLLFLYNPGALIILEASWTEPIILALITLTVYLNFKKRVILTAIIFGFSIATKQYVLLLIPIFTNLMKMKLRFILLSLVTAAVVILPFYLMDPAEFKHDVIDVIASEPPRPWTLVFVSILDKFDLTYNSYLQFLLTGLFIIPFYFQKKLTLGKLLYSSAFILLASFYFNKLGAVNYYYIVSQLVLLGRALEEKTVESPS